MMNVSRYRASGTTHKNGTAATSVEMWLVVAISTMTAHAGQINHAAYCDRRGGASLSLLIESVGGSTGECHMRVATRPVSTANTTNAAVQIAACRGSSHNGSNTNG